MSRYNTQVLSSIRMLCRMQNIDEKVLYERAKLILSIYREVCWSTIDRANDVCDTLICTYGDRVPSRFMRKIICRLRLNEVSRQ